MHCCYLRSQIAKLEQLPSPAWDGEVGEINDLRDYSSEIGGGPCHAGSDSVPSAIVICCWGLRLERSEASWLDGHGRVDFFSCWVFHGDIVGKVVCIACRGAYGK